MSLPDAAAPLLRRIAFASFLLALVCRCYGSRADSTCYELRIYRCFEGRVPALQKRFQEHTLSLFKKHGIRSIGYWLPLHGEPNTLYYIIAYPDRRSRDSMWNAFAQSAEWLEVKRRSEEDGRIVDQVTSLFMTMPALSPRAEAFRSGADHTFELKTYPCASGDCSNLLAAFNDAGRKILEKQGIRTVAVWLASQPDKTPAGVVCLFVHKSEAAARTSWEAIGRDRGWRQITGAPSPYGANATSVLLAPLPFSGIR